MKRYLIKLWNSQGWAHLDEKRPIKHRTNNIRRTARNIFILDPEIDIVAYQENEGDDYTLIRRHEFNYNVVCVEGDGDKRPVDLVFTSHNHCVARRELFRKS